MTSRHRQDPSRCRVRTSIDRVLMVHSLEFAESPRETLKELWRVLAPGGRLVIVVPNRIINVVI